MLMGLPATPPDYMLGNLATASHDFLLYNGTSDHLSIVSKLNADILSVTAKGQPTFDCNKDGLVSF